MRSIRRSIRHPTLPMREASGQKQPGLQLGLSGRQTGRTALPVRSLIANFHFGTPAHSLAPLLRRRTAAGMR